MGLGLEGAYGAAGAAAALRQLIQDRIAADLRRKADAQQQFENSLRTRQLDQGDALRRDTLAEQLRQHAATEDDRLMGRANTLADQLPPQSVLRSGDPAVGMLQMAGRGSLLTPKGVPTPDAPASLLANDAPPVGDLPGTVLNSPSIKGRLFLKGASQKQLDTRRDDDRMAADLARKADADASNADIRGRLADLAGQNADTRGRMADIAGQNAELKAAAAGAKEKAGPKLPQREDDTVVSIHQMSPLVDELLAKTQARIAAKPKPRGGIAGTLGAIPEKAGRLATKAAYSAGLPIEPADSERIQLASLLQILGTVPYLRGIRNMQFVNQIQQHLADPTATDESLIERLQTLKRILPGMEQAIYDVHNQGVIPHAHDHMGAGGGAPAGKPVDPLGIR